MCPFFVFSDLLQHFYGFKWPFIYNPLISDTHPFSLYTVTDVYPFSPSK